MTAETWLSLIAIVISVFSIVLQYTVEGAKIELLNANDTQVRIARPHKELPEHIQKAYPDIPDVLPGYALVKLVFGNAGDRAGIVSIKNLKVLMKDNPHKIEIIKAAYSNYVLIPAYEVVEKEILLRNIQLGEFPELRVEVELKMEYGGYDPRTGKHWHTEELNKTLQVSIVRGDENPTFQMF